MGRGRHVRPSRTRTSWEALERVKDGAPRGSGPGAEAFPYGARASALVKARQDDESVRLQQIEQSVRKAGKKNTADSPVSDGAGERVFRDQPDGEIERRDEASPQTFLTRFVPRVDSPYIVRCEVAEGDGEGHFFLRSEARTADQG